MKTHDTKKQYLPGDNSLNYRLKHEKISKPKTFEIWDTVFYRTISIMRTHVFVMFLESSFETMGDVCKTKNIGYQLHKM